MALSEANISLIAVANSTGSGAVDSALSATNGSISSAISAAANATSLATSNGTAGIGINIGWMLIYFATVDRLVHVNLLC